MSSEASDQNKAAEVFRETIRLLDEQPFDYAVGGGLCTEHWTGGAKTISDIDLMIREEDAAGVLGSLESIGCSISEMEHSWLHKAFKDGATIDLMFQLKNGTRFDEEFAAHLKRGEIFGATPLVMAPEDQITALAGTVDREMIGKHWFHMIDLMSNNDLDWEYLLLRSQNVPRQMLSVVHFAISEEVPIQKGFIEKLTELAAVREGRGSEIG